MIRTELRISEKRCPCYKYRKECQIFSLQAQITRQVAKAQQKGEAMLTKVGEANRKQDWASQLHGVAWLNKISHSMEMPQFIPNKTRFSPERDAA